MSYLFQVIGFFDFIENKDDCKFQKIPFTIEEKTSGPQVLPDLIINIIILTDKLLMSVHQPIGHKTSYGRTSNCLWNLIIIIVFLMEMTKTPPLF